MRTLLLLLALLGTTTTCLAWDHFGAVAYSSSSGAYGYSYGKSTLGSAKATALNKCGRGGQVVGWAKNCYLALSLGRTRGAYGFGYGNSKGEANALALRYCSRHTTNCYIAISVFTGR